MTSAAGSSLRVRKRKRHAPARRILLKILMISVGCAAVAVMTTSAAVFSLKRMHGVAYAARADGSFAVAYGSPPSRLAWTAPADARGTRMLVVAGLPVPETVRSVEAPNGTSALDDVEEEQFTTSSIAAYLPAISIPVVASGLPTI